MSSGSGDRKIRFRTSGNQEFPCRRPIRPAHRDQVYAARPARERESAMHGGGGRDQLAIDIGHPDPGSLADALKADPPRRIGNGDAAEGLAGRLRTRARGAAKGILLEERPYLVGLDQVGSRAIDVPAGKSNP